MKISYCITCMGRLRHLRRTLPKNLSDNADQDVEFVILNYNSPDGLDGWILRAFAEEIRGGRVVHFHEKTAKRFFMSHAKNVAHLLAEGDVLCNLDADNFLGRSFTQALCGAFEANSNRVCRVSGLGGSGGAGRIAVGRENFRRVGGYDEAMRFGWGWEDTDLFLRLRMANVEAKIIKNRDGSVIDHGWDERARLGQAAVRLEASNQLHIAMSRANLKARRIIANRGQTWGEATVYRNFSAKPMYVGYPSLEKFASIGRRWSVRQAALARGCS